MPRSYQTETHEQMLESDSGSDAGYSNCVSDRSSDKDVDSEPDVELTPDEEARVHRKTKFLSINYQRMREQAGRDVAFKACLHRIDASVHMKETPPANFSDKKKLQHAKKYAKAQEFLRAGIKALALHSNGKDEPREEVGNTQRDAFVETWLRETPGVEKDPVRFTTRQKMH